MTPTIKRGETLQFSQLPPKSIALDGFVQGPAMDLVNQKFSFDHHDGCIRMFTSATCRQVQDALLLGLNPAGFEVFINDVDGDTVLSVWLLQHPERANLPAVHELVSVVANMDAHGPAYPVANASLASLFYDSVMAPERNARRNKTYGTADLNELLAECLRNLDRWFAGELQPAVAEETRSYEITYQGNGWVMARSDSFIFDLLYKDGITAAVAWRPLPDGSFEYTIGRKSDLVLGFPVGPHSLPGTLLHALAAAEPGWGGGSSIGGAPRNPDGSRSHLPPERLRAILESALR